MYRYISAMLCTLGGLLMTVAASCSDSKDEPAPPAPKESTCTVLVYMAADTNLGASGYDIDDIDEMKLGASNGALGTGRLIVYHSRKAKDPVLVEITATGTDTIATYDYGTLATDPERMLEVIGKVRDYAPSPKYGLVLWGHGSGWVMDGVDRCSPQSRSGISYSYGPETNNNLSINVDDLAATLSEAGGFDYIYFDCCYMANIETVYELRRCASYIVGSSTELLASGMPYHSNLPLLISGTRDDLIQAATNTFELHNGQASASARTCTMSVIDTEALERLGRATYEVYRASGIPEVPDYEPQRLSDYGTTCYYYDLKDYVEAVCANSSLPDALRQEFQSAFSAAVVYSAHTARLWNSVDLSRENGLSTFLPFYGNYRAEIVEKYDRLEWSSIYGGFFEQPDSERN